MNGAEPGALVAGRYRLGEVTGRGGMGVVWRASDELLHREVAVKEIIWPPQLGEAERGTLCQRALREARTAARLDHPSVIRVYDFIEDGGRPWIVMPLMRYPSLREVVRERGPLPPRRAARIGLQILVALQAAHAAGVLHRDVKPGNVLLGPDDQVVLTDFGMAIADGSTALTTSGVLIGSPAYMAPERARGEPATAAADLWSLGATLYAAVEGRPPFDREGALAVLTAVVSGMPDPPLRAGQLWLVISGLLRKDPAKRLGAAEAGRLLRQAAGVSTAATGAPLAHATLPLAAAEGPAARTVITGRPDGHAGTTVADEGDHRAAAPTGAAGARALIPGLEPRPRPAPDGSGTAPPPAEDAGNRRRVPRRLFLLLGAAAAATLVAVAAITLTQSGPIGHRIAGRPAHMSSEARRHHQHSRLSPAPPRPRSSAPPRAVPSSPAAPGAPGQAGATPPAPGGSGPGPLPAGFSWYRDPTGFSIGVPQGWQVSHEGHLVYVRDPGSDRFLIIDQTTHPKPDPLADWRQQQASRRYTYPGYHLIRLQAVRYAQAQRAADWEFTYYYEGQLLHVLNRNILADAHRAYALYWSTPASQWQAGFRYFRAFAATFRPAGMGQGS
jgi:eukaryotic-like serine/threonine-protein kinase